MKQGTHRCAACGYADLSVAPGRAETLRALQTLLGGHRPHATSREIADILQRPLATVTNQLADLERLGLVTRTATRCGTGGGRKMLHALTFAGRTWRPR